MKKLSLLKLVAAFIFLMPLASYSSSHSPYISCQGIRLICSNINHSTDNTIGTNGQVLTISDFMDPPGEIKKCICP